jgi:hypothetical protein
MNLKRIGGIVVILLGYIALAGAMQNIISRLTPAKPQLPYAEIRIDEAKRVQVLICKDWVLNPRDMDDPNFSTRSETGQDVYYWINLGDSIQSQWFTNLEVHANGPVPQRVYHGFVRWERDQNQIRIRLVRTSTNNTPFAANGIYPVKQVTCAPLADADSI